MAGPAIKISPTSARQRTHRSRSRSAHDHAVASESNSISSGGSYGKVTSVDNLRRDSPSRDTKSPADGLSQSRKKMASKSEWRRESVRGARSTKESKVTVREVGRKSDVKHSHRHPESKRRDSEEEGSVVYVQKTADCRKRDSVSSKPSVIRRSTHAGEAGRDRKERPRMDSSEPSRRQSKRKSSPRDRKYTYSLPLRSEKRSTSSTIFGSRDRQPVARSASMREQAPTSTSRPSLKRSRTSTRETRTTVHATPLPSSYVYEKIERAPSIARRSSRPPSVYGKPERTPSIVGRRDRPSSVFGSIFGSSRHIEPPRPEKRGECLTCMEDLPVSKTALLSCGHRMCHDCLRRIFNLSVKDPQHMPPKCCTNKHIPLKHVDRLFDSTFKRKWNRKYQEYTTKNRLYCPSRACGEWIKPSQIHTDTSGGANGGRKYGKCGRCKTKVCCICNGKWHSSKTCPKDPATQEFIKIAKEEGWQRCFNCSATVELKEGCNHMTCRCRAEFCMICGLKWKTCDCPWFSYATVEADRLDHMNIPYIRRVPVNNPALGYQEELERRREQERRDEALARRIQLLGLDEDDDDNNDDPIDIDLPAFGNRNAHFMNDAFIRRARDILSANYDPAQDHAAHRLVADHLHPARPAAQRPPSPSPRQNQPPLRQPHTPASRAHNNSPHTRPSERVLPRRVATDYDTEAQQHHPTRSGREAARASTLAGIARGRTATGRVDQWRRWVDAGGTA